MRNTPSIQQDIDGIYFFMPILSSGAENICSVMRTYVDEGSSAGDLRTAYTDG